MSCFFTETHIYLGVNEHHGCNLLSNGSEGKNPSTCLSVYLSIYLSGKNDKAKKANLLTFAKSGWRVYGSSGNSSVSLKLFKNIF